MLDAIYIGFLLGICVFLFPADKRPRTFKNFMFAMMFVIIVIVVDFILGKKLNEFIKDFG